MCDGEKNGFTDDLLQDKGETKGKVLVDCDREENCNSRNLRFRASRTQDRQRVITDAAETDFHPRIFIPFSSTKLAQVC